ncbi:MAG: hypothetical protein E7269_07785 [Lachnospiraceae bacterium]|nr:hypothetical protein [Lachnospiraceae bacterium]
MISKPTKKKKRKQHKASILHKKDGTCYLCAILDNSHCQQYVQEHHIFGGPNRIHSEAEGLKVYLCLKHHTSGPVAVHNNADIMQILHEAGQRAYECEHTREQFTAKFGKNYL